MGAALEVIAGRVVAPGATLTPWTVNTGNSLTIRNAPLDRRIYIVQAWAVNQAAGILRIRSPKLHDNVQGIRLRVTAARGFPLFPSPVMQTVTPQDVLTVEQSGSATAEDVEMGALLIFYEDLPGIDARLMRAEDVLPRVKHIFTVENTLTVGTTGDWSGEEAINSEFDLFKANTDYALLGYRVSTRCGTVRYRGADTGNLGVGGPGEPELNWLLGYWFVHLSQTYALPTIPIFNSANKQGILIDAHQDENGTAVTVTSIFAELE